MYMPDTVCMLQLKRNVDARKREKQEEQRARDKIRAKLGAS